LQFIAVPLTRPAGPGKMRPLLDPAGLPARPGEHDMRRTFLATALLASVLTLVHAPSEATVNVGSSGSRIEGSGNVIDQPRTIGSFAAIRVTGPMNVQLKAGDQEQVSVRFDDNLQPMIETVVVDGKTPTLEIRVARDAAFRARRAPTVTVTFKQLEGLSLSGSGEVTVDRVKSPVLAIAIAGSSDVRIDDIDTDTLGVSIAGSGDFRASGRADTQGIRIAGSGDVRTPRLVGKTVKISIAGSGDAQVHANEALEVSIAGSGDVTYAGSPKITQKIMGSGSVRASK
jgi:hypothetical protein